MEFAKRWASLSNVTLSSGDLRERLSAFDAALLEANARADALARFAASPSGREKAGRYWRVDVDALAPDPGGVSAESGTVAIDNPNRAVVACTLSTAAQEHRDLLARAFGTTSATQTKFGALTAAFAQLGAFVYVPPDADASEPIEVAYRGDGASIFPYTVVLAERGSRVTVVQRLEGDVAFVCGVDEVVAGEGAAVSFVACQRLSSNTQFVQTRAARPQRDATISWACAELGSALCVVDLSIAIEAPGITANVTSLFFPSGTQHVDVVSTVNHAVGDSTSQTLVKSAAVDRGQARFLGNIRIAPDAQRSNANLRDDALLLSPNAHVDSVPALEIGANDVKAYHGATVGAIDAEQIFYMESRGIERNAAERMIALGFFEPAIARFPTERLREEIRRGLEGKLG